MPQPCEQADVINSQARKIDAILQNQEQHARDFREAITRLTDILIESTKHTEAIAQLKKETDLLFDKDRVQQERVEARCQVVDIKMAKLDGRIDAMEKLASKYDGADIFEKVKHLHNWMLREQGVHKFIPTAISVLTGLAALYMFITR